MASHNLARIKIGDLEVIGYSFAGEETVVAMPQLDICFDIEKVSSMRHCFHSDLFNLNKASFSLSLTSQSQMSIIC